MYKQNATEHPRQEHVKKCNSSRLQWVVGFEAGLCYELTTTIVG
jgi:hypothetical protein